MASRAHLETIFPNLVGSNWDIESPEDYNYNCIAWAAGEDHRRWWPSLCPVPGMPLDYWPEGVPREETIPSFIMAFETIGYRPCRSGSFLLGFGKVALYADSELTPTHMARRRLFWKGWLSKLGDYEDIFHPRLENVTGSGPNDYGDVVQYLKRSWWRTFRHWMVVRKMRKQVR